MPILQSTSFAVSPGTVLGIVGANGAGKSTLLRLLYRLLRPSAGRVLLDGHDIWQMSAREVACNIAVVLQEQPTDFALSVGEVVALGRTPHRTGLTRSSAQEPRLLILDEPTNHLDIRHQLEVLALIRNLGPTVVTSLHELNIAAGCADAVLLLSQGRTLAHGPAENVLTEALVAQSFGVHVHRQHLAPSGDAHLTFHL